MPVAVDSMNCSPRDSVVDPIGLVVPDKEGSPVMKGALSPSDDSSGVGYRDHKMGLYRPSFAEKLFRFGALDQGS